MTQVDFHSQVSNPVHYACRLLRKAYGAGSKVIVLAEPVSLALLDEALWTFSALDFIPHAYLGKERTEMSPILLTDQLEAPIPFYDCLLNLGTNIPAHFARFERLLEVVRNAPDQLEAGRERYRFYRDRGYRLNHYKVNQ